MSLLKTGIQIGQAVKNVQRLRQVLSVFAKHGFADVVNRMDLGKYLPKRLADFASSSSDRSTPERLRLAFEELGPAFVKLGQLLSTRPEMPESFLIEMQKLQDQVQPLPFAVMKQVVEKELKRPLSEVFQDFQEKPLAAASIGQVHEARLRTGEKVVVKIQRPDIDVIIEQDVALLVFLAGLLEKAVPEIKFAGPKTIVDEFFKAMALELNFRVEANNMIKIAENLSEFTEIVIPKVYRDLSTEKVLTQDKLEGLRITDSAGMRAAGIDRTAVVRVGAKAFFKAVMVDGLFHGDLHGGNVFILPGNKLGIIDFGIVGRLSASARDLLVAMVYSLVNEDYENLCYQYAELGAVTGAIDFEAFQREVRNTISPYLGLSMKEVNVGRVLMDATRIASKYHIRIPGEWMIVFKGIFTMEGMGRTLDPDFDMLSMGQELVQGLVETQYNLDRLKKEFIWTGRDLALLGQSVPRQLRWMMRKWLANDFAWELKSPELREIREVLDLGVRRLGSNFVTAGLFVAGAISLNDREGHLWFGYPAIALLLMALGLFLLIRSNRFK